MTARKTAVRTAEKVEGSASAPVESPVAAPAPKPQHAPKGDSPRLVLDRSADRNPFTELPAEESDEADAVRGGANAYGAFSIETFANSGGLTYTHEDAQGFYDYVKQFAAPNFWYRDGGVAVWAYYEEYDNWQDTYGMDAVNVVYHSGHGGRLADGRVWFPLGADWSGQGTNAWSDKMRLGNERVNYIFWSTCSACPV